MRSIVLGVFLCAVLPLVYSYCFQSPHKNPGIKFCQDETDKTWHPVGSTWRNSKCIDCSCSAESMSCCSAMGIPTGFSEKCIVEYDYTKCSFEVFEKRPCSHSAVGK